ncbi:MAG: DUF3857 domain-containing protein, partial [Candidatus Eisenbacteria bacterium]
LGPAAFLLLFGAADGGQRTEGLWNDIFRKYAGESLVCLQDKIVVDAEYTGDVQRRDVSDTERGGLQADRSAEVALGSKYTTINRYSKKFAVLDAAGAERMREYVVPYWAGQVITHHSAEVVDREGKRVDMPADMIEVRTAYPDEGEIYHRVKDLVFRFEGVPVPCVLLLNYTIEGEEAFGFTDRLFAAAQPTYLQEMQYNFPIGFLAQSAWWERALMTYRAEQPDEQKVASAKGEMNQWFWTYKNVRPLEPEPFSSPVADRAPRILFSPNFEQNWVKLVNWYAKEVDQVLTLGGSDRVLRGPARDAIVDYEALRKAEAERKAALRAVLLAPEDDTLAVEEEEGLLGEEEGLLEEEGGAEAEAAPEVELPPLTDKDKIAAIYKYVQETYETIDIPLGRDGFIPNRPVDVQNLDRIAAKDLALVLVGMLRLAAIEADYAIVSTVDHGLVRTDYPALLQFNRALVVARADGETFLLDPGDHVGGVEDPSWAVEGQAVLVIHEIEEGGIPEWLQIPISGSRANTLSIRGDLVYDTETGVFRKETDVSCRGEMNRLFRERFYAGGSGESAEARRIWLANNFPEGVTAGNWDENRGFTNDDDYEFSFDLTYPSNLAMTKGDSLILSGSVFASLGPAQRFDAGKEERRNPIRFRFAERGKDETRFLLPEGYAYASLPEPVRWRAPFGTVKIEFNGWQDEIECVLEYEIDEPELGAEQAPMLQKFFDQFPLLGNLRVVLLKKAEVDEEGGA